MLKNRVRALISLPPELKAWAESQNRFLSVYIEDLIVKDRKTKEIEDRKYASLKVAITKYFNAKFGDEFVNDLGSVKTVTEEVNYLIENIKDGHIGYESGELDGLSVKNFLDGWVSLYSTKEEAEMAVEMQKGGE